MEFQQEILIDGKNWEFKGKEGVGENIKTLV